MADIKIIDMVKTKAKEFDPLFKRMDTDKKLYFMDAYKMMRPDGVAEMEDVINVTFNDPTTFGMRAVATMGGAQRQTVVEGRDISEQQSAIIEGFIDDIGYAV
ncbi:unnamed protein product, partial [marine sediment metagenome]